MKVENLKPGLVNGSLTVISVAQSKSSNGRVKTLVKAKCVCGDEVELDFYKFWRRNSCGCLKGNFKYFGYDKKLYSSWRAMKVRCFWEACPQYHNYGGRGISVCEGLLDFNLYQKIVGLPPTNKHSVDRIDNDMNYSCGECGECVKMNWGKNVRWATKKQQAENRRICYKVDIDGRAVTLKEACKIKGLPYKQVHERIKRGGWDIYTALNTLVISKTHIRYKQLRK